MDKGHQTRGCRGAQLKEGGVRQVLGEGAGGARVPCVRMTRKTSSLFAADLHVQLLNVSSKL